MKSQILWKLLLATPALLGTALVISANAYAASTLSTEESSQPQVAETLAPELTVAQAAPSPTPGEAIQQIQRYNRDLTGERGEGQVTSVSQLRDVQPTDWAFQALQSLVERYGCIAGYPDGTFRGNRALTRFEFAAGLNACLDRINELIAAATANLLTRDDLTTLVRLQEEFAAELATLRGRVDALEARTAELEANQFSTTTKLNAEVIFGVINAFGDERANSDEEIDSITTLSSRVRLNFDTTFPGGSTMRTRLQAGSVDNYSGPTGTDMARIGYAADSGNVFVLDVLSYRLPVGDSLALWAGAAGLEAEDVHPILSPGNSSGSAAVSRFGQRNAVNRLGDGIGFGIDYELTDDFRITGTYFTDSGNEPTAENGLFNGQFQAMGQITYEGDFFGLGVSYARTYHPGSNGVNLTGSTGSEIAQAPFGEETNTAANVLGAQANFSFGDINVGGWFGWWDVIEQTRDDDERHSGIHTWMGYVMFRDLFAEGNFAGIQVGMPPKVMSGSNTEDDTSIHIEGFYRLRVSDNISITPGVYVILNPEHDDDNDTIYVGTIRTTFKF